MRKTKTKPDLTFLQQAFIENYINPDSETFGNATKSYLKAGYKQTASARQDACKLLTKSNIQANIALKRQETERKADVSREWILSKLMDQHDKADLASDRTNALRALELMGKSIAMFSDNTNLNLGIDKPKDLTDKEIEMLRDHARLLTASPEPVLPPVKPVQCQVIEQEHGQDGGGEGGQAGDVKNE